jgi:hypothetical protein
MSISVRRLDKDAMNTHIETRLQKEQNMQKEQVSRETFSVGRYRCTITFADGAINTEWQPHRPRDLNKAELQQYRAGRDAFLANVVGPGKVLVIEA